MIEINFYPDCQKPEWLKPGEWCYCLGEGFDVFTIDQVFDRTATLLTSADENHGLESITKLFRTIEELNQRDSKQNE